MRARIVRALAILIILLAVGAVPSTTPPASAEPRAPNYTPAPTVFKVYPTSFPNIYNTHYLSDDTKYLILVPAHAKKVEAQVFLAADKYYYYVEADGSCENLDIDVDIDGLGISETDKSMDANMYFVWWPRSTPMLQLRDAGGKCRVIGTVVPVFLVISVRNPAPGESYTIDWVKINFTVKLVRVGDNGERVVVASRSFRVYSDNDIVVRTIDQTTLSFENTAFEVNRGAALVYGDRALGNAITIIHPLKLSYTVRDEDPSPHFLHVIKIKYTARSVNPLDVPARGSTYLYGEVLRSTTVDISLPAGSLVTVSFYAGSYSTYGSFMGWRWNLTLRLYSVIGAAQVYNDTFTLDDVRYIQFVLLSPVTTVLNESIRTMNGTRTVENLFYAYAVYVVHASEGSRLTVSAWTSSATGEVLAREVFVVEGDGYYERTGTVSLVPGTVVANSTYRVEYVLDGASGSFEVSSGEVSVYGVSGSIRITLEFALFFILVSAFVLLFIAIFTGSTHVFTAVYNLMIALIIVLAGPSLLNIILHVADPSFEYPITYGTISGVVEHLVFKVRGILYTRGILITNVGSVFINQIGSAAITALLIGVALLIAALASGVIPIIGSGTATVLASFANIFIRVGLRILGIALLFGTVLTLVGHLLIVASALYYYAILVVLTVESASIIFYALASSTGDTAPLVRSIISYYMTLLAVILVPYVLDSVNRSVALSDPTIYIGITVPILNVGINVPLTIPISKLVLGIFNLVFALAALNIAFSLMMRTLTR